jgi:hypothetical protein
MGRVSLSMICSVLQFPFPSPVARRVVRVLIGLSSNKARKYVKIRRYEWLVERLLFPVREPPYMRGFLWYKRGSLWGGWIYMVD